MGHQTLLESLRGFDEDQTLVDDLHAVYHCHWLCLYCVLTPVAFTSATHDIAADGYYMHALDDHEQSLYVGIRSTFYRIATVAGQGLLVILAGFLEDSTGDIPWAWAITFGIMSVTFVLLSIYHGFILSRPASDKPIQGVTARTVAREFLETFRTFFTKKNACCCIACRRHSW